MDKKLLLKHQIFAIRNEDWLFNICPMPDMIRPDLKRDSMISNLLGSDKPKQWHKRLFFTPKTEREWRDIVYESDEFSTYMKKWETYKKSEWDKAREKYSLVEVKKAGSFEVHLIIIKENSTGYIFRCFCNNYGGDNNWIELTEL